MTSLESSIAVSFSTHLPASFQVDSAPIVLPTSSDRAALSALLNDLLGTQTAFDFRVKATQEFLVAEIAALKDLNSEEILHLEYFFAVTVAQVSVDSDHHDWITALAAHGCPVAVGGVDGVVTCETWKFQDAGVVSALASDATSLCVGFSTGKFYVFNRPGFETRTVRDFESAVSAIFIPSASEPLVGLQSGKVLSTDSTVLYQSSDRSSVTGVARLAEPSSATTVFATNSGLLTVTVKQRLKTHRTSSGVSCLAASEDRVATGHEDGTVSVFRVLTDTLDLETLAVWRTHVRLVSSLDWQVTGGCGSLLVSSSLDGKLKLWDLRLKGVARMEVGLEDKVNAVQWVSEDEVVAGGKSGKLRRVQFAGLRTEEELRTARE